MIFGSHALHECVIETTDTNTVYCGRLTQMVKSSAKTTSCKPLSRRYEFDSSQGQFVCLDMFVNGLTVTCRSGWFHSAPWLSRGRTQGLAFLHLNSPRHFVQDPFKFRHKIAKLFSPSLTLNAFLMQITI